MSNYFLITFLQQRKDKGKPSYTNSTTNQSIGEWYLSIRRSNPDYSVTIINFVALTKSEFDRINDLEKVVTRLT